MKKNLLNLTFVYYAFFRLIEDNIVPLSLSTKKRNFVIMKNYPKKLSREGVEPNIIIL